MLNNLKFGKKNLEILCLGAHCDDVEIGCGASLIRLATEYSIAKMVWVVLCSSEIRKSELLASAAALSTKLNDLEIEVVCESFRDSYLPYEEAEIKDFLIQVAEEFPDPDIIFTHAGQDMHQDHRVVNGLTYNLYRNHLILEYEILKTDVDTGRPNFFIPISDAQADTKIEILMNSYKSQLDKQWFKSENFRSLMSIRGVNCSSATGLAEAFFCNKFVI